ncbi:11446_t:CDS:2 [Gigaspora margarita]|uniref:11446_t:CDS:1 n=1 Tax=Gigaspora margarita TaxID=4874 RepID=A0ABN7UZM7_GIGMA|nr:11446_t:CDS:2 [Gigaspora margarita]
MSNYMLENDIPSVHNDESSDCEKLSKYEESHAYKTKKRKKHDNSSIVWDYFKIETTKKGDFTICQICKENNITVQYAHDSSTRNMLGHLWTKHQIDKDHPERTITNGSIIKAIHVITRHRQEKIVQLLSRNQLFSMINADGGYVNLTMDLWTLRTNQEYIGVMVIWIDSNFELKEALLMIRPLPLPHTAEAIEDCLNQVITNWGLTRRMMHKKNADIQRFTKQSMTCQQDETPQSERCDRLDGKYLKLINLTKNEWRLLNNFILLLKLFYKATNIFSGSSYSTHNLIYPTMRLLIKKFASSYEQTKDDYADLLFEPTTSTTITGSARMKKKQVYDKTKKNTHGSQFKDCQLIELPVTNEMLYDLVKATSYFSLEEYWEVTIFDTVRTLCAEKEYHQPLIRLDESVSMAVHKPITTNDLIADLYSSEKLDDEIYNETEADRYLRELIEKKGCNPLTWWKDRSEKYPVLSRLAWKYLSVPATSVPSERLFSNARLHITALRNRLHPDIVEQIIFLKRNMQHFPIFKPDKSNKSNDTQPKIVMN